MASPARREAVSKVSKMNRQVISHIAKDFFRPTKNVRCDDLLELVRSLLTISSFRPLKKNSPYIHVVT